MAEEKHELSNRLAELMTPEVLRGSKDTSLRQVNPEETSLSTMRNKEQEEQIMRDTLQKMMQQQANPTLTLNTSAGKQQKATITTAIAQGVKQAADSNQEEYGTAARKALGKRAEDAAYVAIRGIHNDVYNQSQKYLTTALEYSQTKGGMAALQQQGNRLVEQLNSMNTHDRFAFQYTLDSFTEQSGNIYSNTLSASDGKLHLTYGNDAGGYMEKPSVDLKSSIGDRKANELLTDIGSYHNAYTRQRQSVEVLTGSSAHAGTHHTDSWENLVTGNFQTLDQRFDFSQRYNNYIHAQQSENKALRSAQELADPGMRSFTGTKEEVEKLRHAVDENGNHIFSEEELAELEECVKACGYNQPAGNRRVLENASERARRRFAGSLLDETQAAGLGTLTSASHAVQTAKNLSAATGGLAKELTANLADKKTRDLVDKVSRSDGLSDKRIAEAKKRLEQKKQKLGMDSNKELLERTKKIRENAVEQRAKKKELRAFTRGMDRTQAKLALNQLRQEERLLRHKKPSRRLNRKTEALQRRLSRQQRMKEIRKRLTPKLITDTKNKLTNSMFGRAYGKASSVVNHAVSALKKGAFKFLIIPAAIVIAVVFLAAGVNLIWMLCCYPFTEDNGNLDMSGKSANDLQIVNEAMSQHEADQMAALKNNIETVTKANYIKRPELDGHPDAAYEGSVQVSTNKIKYKGKWYTINGWYIKNADGTFTEITKAQADIHSGVCYDCITVAGEDLYFEHVGDRVTSGVDPDMSVEVTADYDIHDEFGRDAGICNCMQLVSLYRYYYLFIHDGDEADAENYWINDFKDGRMLDAWDRTHFVSVKGSFAPAHTEKWSDGVPYENLLITGDLPGEVVYHGRSDLGECTNAGYYSYWVYPPYGTPYKVMVSCCFGHVKSTAKVQVDTKLETLASGNRLRTADGTEITWEMFEEEDTCEYLNDFLGTYEEYYMPGYEMYAEYEVYFGSAAQMLTSADIEKILSMITDVYGELSPQQTAVITKALEGCGRFTYSMAAHGNCGEGVQGGATDCSGFVSWVHNNCGLYSNTGICNTTTAWSLAPGHITNFSLHSLKPGDLIVKGEPGAASASEGNSNHVVIWLGYLKDEDGNEAPWVVECGGGRGGSGCGIKNNVVNYQTAVPLGSSDTW